MKHNILIASFLLIFFATITPSCSNDDDNKPETVNPGQNLTPKISVTLINNSTVFNGINFVSTSGKETITSSNSVYEFNTRFQNISASGRLNMLSGTTDNLNKITFIDGNNNIYESIDDYVIYSITKSEEVLDPNQNNVKLIKGKISFNGQFNLIQGSDIIERNVKVSGNVIF